MKMTQGPPGRPLKDPAQALIIFAVLIPVLLLFFLFALGLAALLDTKAHAEYALSVATRAGARQIEYADYGEGSATFDPAAVEDRTKAVFEDGLRLRTTGLARPPEEVAWELTNVEIGYGAPGSPWQSSFGGTEHIYPTVAAQAWVPIRVWMFDVTVAIVSETEVR